MSKLWFLLLLVAAIGFVQSYPEGESESERESEWNGITRSWNLLVSRYKKLSPKKIRELAAQLNTAFCPEEEVNIGRHLGEVAGTREEFIDTIKELYRQLLTNKVQETQEDMLQRIADTRAKLCAELKKLSDFHDDDEEEEEEDDFDAVFPNNQLEDDEYVLPENDWLGDYEDEDRAFIRKFRRGAKKGLQKLKEKLKKSAEKMKEMGIKVNPLKCEGKFCKSCISLTIGDKDLVCCIQFGLFRSNKATYLDVGIGKEDKYFSEKRIMLGELPKCLNLGGFIGKICLKGIEGRAKPSRGQPHLNFCLGVLVEAHGFGVKFCATYINKKFDIEFVPEVFVGGLDEDGDMVKKKGEDDVVVFDEDEYVID